MELNDDIRKVIRLMVDQIVMSRTLQYVPKVGQLGSSSVNSRTSSYCILF